MIGYLYTECISITKDTPKCEVQIGDIRISQVQKNEECLPEAKQSIKR